MEAKLIRTTKHEDGTYTKRYDCPHGFAAAAGSYPIFLDKVLDGKKSSYNVSCPFFEWEQKGIGTLNEATSAIQSFVSDFYMVSPANYKRIKNDETRKRYIDNVDRLVNGRKEAAEQEKNEYSGQIVKDPMYFLENRTDDLYVAAFKLKVYAAFEKWIAEPREDCYKPVPGDTSLDVKTKAYIGALKSLKEWSERKMREHAMYSSLNNNAMYLMFNHLKVQVLCRIAEEMEYYCETLCEAHDEANDIKMLLGAEEARLEKAES